MKNKVQLLVFSILFNAVAFAQKTDVATSPATNIFKINLTALPLKNIGVQYEKFTSRKISLLLGFRVMPETDLPFKNQWIDDVAGNDQDTRNIINNARFSNYAITPEMRIYLGKGWGKGFYIAPYYRYVHFATNTVPVSYNEPNGPQRTLNMSGEMSANTGGVMFGSQWLLGKHITLDWWIIGAHYGSGNGSFSGVPSAAFTAGEQTDIKQTIDDIDIPLVKKQVTVTANKIQVDVSGPFGGLRSGLSLGVRF